MAATIVDVAARAGVSTATVSRVLSGSATALGRWAVERIASALQGRGEAARVSLNPRLVIRGSTASPPNA